MRRKVSGPPARPRADGSLAVRILVAALPAIVATVWWSDAIGRFGRPGFPLDDPYIHFQFARNLAHGAGMSFNPGEPVPGATSPLWALLLAPAFWVGVPVETWVALLGVACASATAVLTLECGRAAGMSPLVSTLAAVATGVTGRFVWASLSGMEPCLAAALSLALLRVHLGGATGNRRGLMLGLFAGLAVNTRPETMLLAAIVGALELWRSRRERTSPVPIVVFGLTLAAMIVPYVLFCLATSGRPLPNTWYAKSVIPLAQGAAGAAQLRAQYLPEALRWVLDDDAALGLLLLPGLIVWLRRSWGRPALSVALWPLAFWAYSMVSYPRHFSLSRYTIPLIPCLALVSASALDVLLRRVPPSARTVTAWVAGAAVVVSAAWTLPPLQAVYRAQVRNILEMQVAMADWVATNLPPGARVATNDVGAIRFYGGRYVIDTVGLTSSEVIRRDLEWIRRHRTFDADQVLAEWFAEEPPDVVIVFPEWYPRLVTASWLQPIHEVRTPNVTGGGDRLIAYRVAGRPDRARPLQ